MTRELKREADKFISKSGYGKESNLTIGQISTLMACFATVAIKNNGVIHNITQCDCMEDKKTGTTAVMCCNICGLPDDKGWIVG